MEARLEYRHNAMAIQSIDTFTGIKGGYHNNTRDVYFVCALGEPNDLSGFIAGIDSGQNINLAVGYEDIKMFARGFY